MRTIRRSGGRERLACITVPRSSSSVASSHVRTTATNQFAAAFSGTAVDCNRDTVHCHGAVSRNNLVDAVWLSARVALGTFDLVAQAGDGLAVDVVLGGASDDFAAVVGGVAYYNNLLGHL